MKILVILLALFALISTNIQAQSKAQKKILATYFSIPERDGVDASTGVSRIVSGGKLLGATELVWLHYEVLGLFAIAFSGGIGSVVALF